MCIVGVMGEPMYQVIADQLRGQIAAGEYPVGSRLPTIRSQQVRFSTTATTIRRAFETLEADGLVDMTRGRGTYVVAVPDLDAAAVLARLRESHALLGRAIKDLEDMKISST